MNYIRALAPRIDGTWELVKKTIVHGYNKRHRIARAMR